MDPITWSQCLEPVHYVQLINDRYEVYSDAVPVAEDRQA